MQNELCLPRINELLIVMCDLIIMRYDKSCSEAVMRIDDENGIASSVFLTFETILKL